MKITTWKIKLFVAINKKKKSENNNNITLIQNQQTKIDIVNINNNNWTTLVRPSFSGETYLVLKNFSRLPDRYIYIIIKSPPEKHSDCKTKMKENVEETKPLNEYKNAIMVFDDILGTSKGNYIEQFFKRGRHKTLDIFCLSQPFFDLPKRTKRNNSDKITLFNRTLKNIENVWRDVGGYDMSYDEFKQVCRKSISFKTFQVIILFIENCFYSKEKLPIKWML